MGGTALSAFFTPRFVSWFGYIATHIIIAVARGGLLPAGALSYAMGVKLSDAVNVEFYTDVHETLPDPVLLAPMLDTDSISDKKVLVVDDVVDSGRTLSLVLELLRGYGAELILTPAAEGMAGAVRRAGLFCAGPSPDPVAGAGRRIAPYPS